MKAEPTHVETLPIEIGMVIAGKLDLVNRQAFDDAIAATGSALTQSHQSAGLTFHFVKVQRRDLVSESRIEPSVLLRQAQEERDARGWDFAFVVTASELLGKYSATSCFAALSRPLDAAVISTSLIDPDTNGLTLAVAMTDALPPLSSQKMSSATDSRTIDGDDPTDNGRGVESCSDAKQCFGDDNRVCCRNRDDGVCRCSPAASDSPPPHP